ncbi:MAG: AI-2E family transporter, partial [Actinomycetota bacterium]|nr:AI-2E family transporter [Actinomycetota bacterium]
MHPPSPPAPSKPVVVPRWVQLVALLIGLLALWALARAAHNVLLVFLVSSVIALILNPLVKRVQRPLGSRGFHLPRGLAVFGVYIGFFLALGGIGVLLANPITDQVRTLQRDVPNLVTSANRSLADFQRWLDRQGINVKVKQQGETALQTLQRKVVSSSGSLVSFGQDLLKRVVETGFGLILVIVISIYMLLYADRIGRLVRSVMPPGDGSREDDFALRVQKAVSSYVRGQALFSVLMGMSAGVAMWLLGVTGVFPDGRRYALFFGLFFGLMELVPYIGPVLGAIPPILVALFSDPLTAVWVTLTFVALQQLEGHVVAPQVFGHSLRINPLLVIFALLIGAELYGILGAFIALPLAAVARETVAYLRRHLVLEPWGPRPAVAGAGDGDPLVEVGVADPDLPPARCVVC